MAITAAPLLSKIMNARIAGHAGTGRQQTLVMVNTSMFRHPKYYKELRKRNKSDQAISLSPGDGQVERSTDPGPKLQATSNKPQAPSLEKKEPQASSDKQQASSATPHASRSKL